MVDISRLDGELLVQILCRVGAFKYAVQCKSVCKYWYSTMDTSSSDSHFMCRWRQINNKEQGVLITQYSYLNETGYEYRHSVDRNTEELPSLDLNFMPSVGPICILGSSKDLLLCSPYPYDHTCYYLCNPFTKKWTTLPPPPAPQMEEVWLTEDIKVGFIVHDHDHGRDIKFTVLRIVPYRFERSMGYTGPGDIKLHIFVYESGCAWRQIMDADEGGRRTMFLALFRRGSQIISYKGMPWFFEYGACGSETARIGYKVDAAGGSPTCFVLPTYQEPDAQHRCYSVIGACPGLLRLAQLVRRPLTLVVWQLHDGEGQEWDMVEELVIKEMVEGLEDCDMVRCYYGHQPWKVEVLPLAFHPHGGDTLYLSFCLQPGQKAQMYIFSCHLKKRRLELIRAITTTYRDYEVPRYSPKPGFFPIVPPCWPTTVPLLQPYNC